jgi:hypothetical protein
MDTADRHIEPGSPDIRKTELALRAAGLTRRQARALLAKGWAGVVSEERAEADALRVELDALRERLIGPIIDSSPPAA